MITKAMEARLPDGRRLRWQAHFPTDVLEFSDSLECRVVEACLRDDMAISYQMLTEAYADLCPHLVEPVWRDHYSLFLSELWKLAPENNAFTWSLRSTIVFGLIKIEEKAGARIIKDGGDPLSLLARYRGWVQSGKPGGLEAFVAFVGGKPLKRRKASKVVGGDTWPWGQVTLRFDDKMETAIVLHGAKEIRHVSKASLGVKPSAWKCLQRIAANQGPLKTPGPDTALSKAEKTALSDLTTALEKACPECEGKAIKGGKAQFQILIAQNIELAILERKQESDNWRDKHGFPDPPDPGTKALLKEETARLPRRNKRRL